METPVIDTNPDRLDREMIFQFLKDTYWGKGRSREQVYLTINRSLNFGMYLGAGVHQQQVGYCRVLTDGVVLSYLFDVFVLPEFRDRGWGKLLIKAVLEHPVCRESNFWLLGTKDAQGLYEQFGFKRVPSDNLLMSRPKNLD